MRRTAAITLVILFASISLSLDARDAAQGRRSGTVGITVFEDPNYRGKLLQLHFMVEDDGVLTMPWTATITYRPNLGPWSEVICAENLQWYPGKNSEVPQADKPDF